MDFDGCTFGDEFLGFQDDFTQNWFVICGRRVSRCITSGIMAGERFMFSRVPRKTWIMSSRNTSWYPLGWMSTARDNSAAFAKGLWRDQMMGVPTPDWRGDWQTEGSHSFKVAMLLARSVAVLDGWTKRDGFTAPPKVRRVWQWADLPEAWMVRPCTAVRPLLLTRQYALDQSYFLAIIGVVGKAWRSATTWWVVRGRQ